MAELERDPVTCCAPEQQTSCCEPQDKDSCCTPGESSCGCASEGGQEDVRERYSPATLPYTSTPAPR
jgi:hypothetical protein